MKGKKFKPAVRLKKFKPAVRFYFLRIMTDTNIVVDNPGATQGGRKESDDHTEQTCDYITSSHGPS